MPLPPTMFSTPAMPAIVSVPSLTLTLPSTATVTVRFEITAEKSSVSDPVPRSSKAASSAPTTISSPAPPATESTLPPVKLKRSAPVPPARFSIFEKLTPSTLPVLSPVMSQLLLSFAPVKVSLPRPPFTLTMLATVPLTPVALLVFRSTAMSLL